MRFLIVDDSPADRELAMRELVQEFGEAEFVEIGRKPDFGAALDEGGFDAVLTDFRLHWADGLWILKEVRARYPYVPVVFITESGSEEIAVEGMKAGLSDYVLKQHPHRLPVALRESLEKAALRQNYDRALSELQQAHSELQQAAEGLEQRVVERTAELARANQELRAEMAVRHRVEEERGRLLAENLAQREILEHLIASAPIGIAVLAGPDHSYQLANPAYRAALGLSEEGSFPGQPFARVTPDLAGLVPDLLEPARAAGEPVSLIEYERTATVRQGTATGEGARGEGQDVEGRSGASPLLPPVSYSLFPSQSYWDLHAVPLHDRHGGVAELLLLVNDVTQKVLARTQAEELAVQLGADRSFLTSIMNSVPVAVAYLDQELIFRQCNQAAEREFGLPAAQLLGRHLHEVVPSGSRLRAAVESVLRSGEPFPEPIITENWPAGPGGGERHYMVGFLPDRGPAGGVRGVFAACQDITDVVEARRRLAEQDQLRLGREQMKEFSRRLLDAQERQARAIAMELHDESGQALTALMLGLSALQHDPACPPAIAGRIAELIRASDGIMEGLHRLAANLRPATLDRLGLVAALRQHVEAFREQTGLDAQFVTVGLGEQRPPAEIETAVYRIVQEALTNCARHARAASISVLLERKRDAIVAIVEDDGVGFDADEVERRGRLGVLGMRERAEMSGGKLTVESSPGRGACIFVEFPLPPPGAGLSSTRQTESLRTSDAQGF